MSADDDAQAVLRDMGAGRYPARDAFDRLLDRLRGARQAAAETGDFAAAAQLQATVKDLLAHRARVDAAAARLDARAVYDEAAEILAEARQGHQPNVNEHEGLLHRIGEAAARMLAEQDFELADRLQHQARALRDQPVGAGTAQLRRPGRRAEAAPVGRLPDPAHSTALLLGAAGYADPDIADLPSVYANLTDLGAALGDATYGGFDRRRVHLLADPDLTVPADVAELGADVSDTLVVYFAGHGTVDPDGQLYLSVPLTRPGHEEFTAIAYHRLRQAVRRSPARRRIIILDCCYSGRAADAMSGDGPVPAAQLDVAGTYVLTSTSSVRPSHAPPGERNTAFTAGLLHVLTGGLDNGESLLRLSEVFGALSRHLTSRGFPAPHQRLTDAAATVALTRNPAWPAGPGFDPLSGSTA